MRRQSTIAKGLVWARACPWFTLLVALSACGSEPAPEEKRQSCEPPRKMLVDTRQATWAQENRGDFSLQTFESALPIFVIDTGGEPIVDEPKVAASLHISSSSPLNSTDTEYGIGIELRGGGSILADKKQFGVEVRDAEGKDSPASLLGLPENADWVLAAQAGDATRLRNRIAYELARSMGLTAPQSRFVEVFANQRGELLDEGDYLGLYLLVEKLQSAPASLGVAKQGGFIVELTMPDVVWPDANWFCGKRSGASIVIGQPKLAGPDDPRRQAIVDKLDAIEDGVFDGKLTALEKGANVDSFVDYLIINDLVRNADAFVRSFFAYAQPGGKLTLGPVWDMDVSMSGDGLVRHSGTWAAELSESEEFSERVRQRYQELRNHELADDTLKSLVERESLSIQAAVQRDALRWPELQPWQPRVEQLQRWLLTRAKELESLY